MATGALVSDTLVLMDELPLPGSTPWLALPSQVAALSALEAWLASGKPGIGVLTGGEGSGRTRVLEQIVLWLAERDDRPIGFPRAVPGKRSDAGLLREAIVALGSEPTGRTGLQLTSDLRQVVTDLSAGGMPPLLLLDDADLTGSQLEILGAVFGGGSADRAALSLQVLMAGPPEVLDRLQRRPRLARLVGTSSHLAGPTSAEIEDLLEAWLGIARQGDPDLPTLSNGARESILQVAGSNPTIAFDLLRTALTSARRMGTRRIGAGLTEAVAASLGTGKASSHRPRRRTLETVQTPATLPLPGLDEVTARGGEVGP
jgi:type II secretory pathway predicted ATPase ExeA